MLPPCYFARVVKWQTRQLEGLVGATPWRFESSPEHQRKKRAAGMAPLFFCQCLVWLVASPPADAFGGFGDFLSLGFGAQAAAGFAGQPHF